MNQNYRPFSLDAPIDQVDEWASAYLAVSESKKARIEIPKALEGDIWHIDGCKPSRRYFVEKKTLIQPSSDRLAAKCPHFESCGGCQWQHLAPSSLLERKAQWVKKWLGNCIDERTFWHEPFLSPSLWRYRNKMEYSFGQTKEGHQTLGLYQTRSKVIDLEQCHIAPSWFERALEATRAWWRASGLDAYYAPRDEGSLRTLMLRQSIKGEGAIAVLTVSGNSNFALTQVQIDAFKEAILSSYEGPCEQLTLFITLHQAIRGQPTRFFEIHLNGPDVMLERLEIDWGKGSHSFEFTISPSTFFQPNTLAAEVLYGKALKMLQPDNCDLIWDLFCGSGTLSIIASRWAKRVIGVEINPMAVLDAQANAKANAQRTGFDMPEFLCADLHKSPANSLGPLLEKGRPDAVLVDPPRAGLLEAGARLLGEIAPKKIVYISCNPRTQAQDILALKSYGYHLSELAVVDQFPHTGHVETVGLLLL